MSCIFCKIANGDIPADIITSDEQVIAFLDINPSAKGHALVVPVTHVEDLTALDDTLVSAVFSTAREVGKALMDTLGCEGFNVIMNNGSAAGQVVFHAHIHVIPRNHDDGVMPKMARAQYADGESAKLATTLAGHLSK